MPVRLLRERDITLFESHGIALRDIAIAAEAYEKAVAQKVGDDLSFGE